MPKKIIAWVTDYFKIQFDNAGVDILYVNSVEELKENLTLDCIPILSTTLAASNYEKVDAMLKSHLNIHFYIMRRDLEELKEEHEKGIKAKYYAEGFEENDFNIRNSPNVELGPQLPEDIIRLLG